MFNRLVGNILETYQNTMIENCVWLKLCFNDDFGQVLSIDNKFHQL